MAAGALYCAQRTSLACDDSFKDDMIAGASWASSGGRGRPGGVGRGLPVCFGAFWLSVRAPSFGSGATLAPAAGVVRGV